MTPQAINFALPHITLACQRWPIGKRGVIVALHGWMDNSNSFAPLASFIEEYELLAVDFAGHGLSTHRPANAYYHLVDYVHDIIALLQNLDIGPVILMGHSLGGSIAQAIAATYPEFVSRLILLDTPGPIVAAAEQTVNTLRQSMDMRLVSRPEKPTRKNISIEQAIAARLRAGEMDEANARLLVERNLVVQECGGSWRSDPRLRIYSPVRLTDEQADNIVANIQCPTMLIEAENTIPLVRKAIKRRLPYFKALEHSLVPGRHHVHMDTPEIIWPVIQRFLAK